MPKWRIVLGKMKLPAFQGNQLDHPDPVAIVCCNSQQENGQWQTWTDCLNN